MNSNHYQLFTILIGFRTASPKKIMIFFYATDYSSSSSESPVIRLMPNWSTNFW